MSISFYKTFIAVFVKVFHRTQHIFRLLMVLHEVMRHSGKPTAGAAGGSRAHLVHPTCAQLAARMVPWRYAGGSKAARELLMTVI